ERGLARPGGAGDHDHAGLAEAGREVAGELGGEAGAPVEDLGLVFAEGPQAAVGRFAFPAGGGRVVLSGEEFSGHAQPDRAAAALVDLGPQAPLPVEEVLLEPIEGEADPGPRFGGVAVLGGEAGALGLEQGLELLAVVRVQDAFDGFSGAGVRGPAVLGAG